MKLKKNQTVYILDTSAILSGKLLDLNGYKIIAPAGVSKEIQPGGKDYRNFQFLKEKGLLILSPKNESIKKIKDISTKTGDVGRLSDTDLEVLAMAWEEKKHHKNLVILTDDYAIQNVANFLDIRFLTVDQPGIKKRFKWFSQCQGCGKIFKENITTCPICGANTKKKVFKKSDVKRLK